ncbi:hypothetical protein GLYMA_12G151000v4 [Glycine max]|uniref:Uncharacterized protein n=2 Tax=Glycine subgen. Soja TaxID=1462606 RepID=A0A0R0H5D4_SOYBN|nr:hypothetical protein GYH30_033811 [Glycine max]KRH26081.1 hypothetical protein GLYMA_12G151000v4 [Glycine max]RZB75950.1 hypothetical protein D0Y65_034454 [Glycine soja]
MDVEDAENEVSVSSAILNLIASRPNEVLSPEDLAWVDSCLVKDSDNSETDWIPLKNALLDIISSQPQSFSTEEQSSTSVKHNKQSSTFDWKRLSEPSSTYNVKLLMAVETSTDEIPDDEKTDGAPRRDIFKIWDLDI